VGFDGYTGGKGPVAESTGPTGATGSTGLAGASSQLLSSTSAYNVTVSPQTDTPGSTFYLLNFSTTVPSTNPLWPQGIEMTGSFSNCPYDIMSLYTDGTGSNWAAYSRILLNPLFVPDGSTPASLSLDYTLYYLYINADQGGGGGPGSGT
jgi:hypothetical protein